MIEISYRYWIYLFEFHLSPNAFTEKKIPFSTFNTYLDRVVRNSESKILTFTM